VAKRSGEVIAGNTRLKAAQSLGLTEVPVVWFDGSDLDADRLLDRRQPHARVRVVGRARARQAARRSCAPRTRSKASATSDHDIDRLLKDSASEHARGRARRPGRQEPPVQPVTQLGDLWLLGEHRLLCGDSTNAADVARLLDGENAPPLSTDPPYCVDYTGNDRPIHDGKPSGKDWSHVYREVDIKDLGAFLDDVMRAACRT
jgi:hypothetical protein